MWTRSEEPGGGARVTPAVVSMLKSRIHSRGERAHHNAKASLRWL
jgi:hypothetical protein